MAALMSGRLDASGEIVVPILSGGNQDISMLQTLLTHELTARKQQIRLRVRIDDGPGKLADISDRIAGLDANIRTVYHYRADNSLSVGDAFPVETSGESHAAKIIETTEEQGYDVDLVN